MRQLSIFIIFCWASVSWAQKGHSFELGAHYGTLIKHREYINIPVDQLPPTLGGEINWSYQTHGKRAWEALANYPEFGLILSFQDFADPRLGWGLGLMPQLKFPFWRSGDWEIYGRLGMGVAYVSNYGNSFRNPDNNIIGSHWNNNTAFRLGLQLPLSNQWLLQPSFSFTHYSNGASQFPNLGINAASLHLGLRYRPQALQKEDYQAPPEDYQPPKRWGVGFDLGLGMTEVRRTERGPKFALYSAMIYGSYRYASTKTLRFGLLGEYHTGVEAFWLSNLTLTPKEARQKAQRLLFWAGHEWLLGHIGLGLQVGYYITEPVVKLPYTRGSIAYYPFSPLKHKHTPYLAVRIKAHGITADFFDLAIGLDF